MQFAKKHKYYNRDTKLQHTGAKRKLIGGWGRVDAAVWLGGKGSVGDERVG